MRVSFIFTCRFMLLVVILGWNISSTGMCQQNQTDQSPVTNLPGDCDGDGVYTSFDVDMLTESGIIGARGYLPDIETEKFDLDLDGLVTQLDIFWLVGLIEVVDEENPGIVPQNCVPGDITFDGLVDTLDVNHLHVCHDWAILFPLTWLFKYSHSDTNGDGMVDEADFNIICDNWTPGGVACPGRAPWIQP